MITPAYSPTATERVLPRMALDFTTGVLDPRVTVTRALNTATRVNSSGAIEIVNANLPRFDYDPATLAPKGLLIEEARTNVALTSTFATLAGSAGSQYPSGTGWSNFFNTGGTRTYVASSVFAGSQAMDIVDVTAARNLIGFSFAAASSTTYTVSFYVESVSGATGTIAYTSGALGTGGTTNSVSAPTTTGRYSYTFTTGTGAGTVDLRLGIGTSGNANGNIRISNYQVEVGAFATSYIPTTTSSLTRNADDVTMTGTNFTSWYSASAGTFISTFSAAASTASVLVTDASGSGRPLYIVGGGVVRIFDGTAPINAGGTYTFGTVASAGSSYGGGTMSCALNGGTVGTGAFDGSMGTSALYIGRNPAQPNEYIKGHIQKVAFYPMRFSDRELQAFSK